MESNFLQSQWVQRRGLFLADTWRLNPKFKPATGRSLEYEASRGTTSWQAKQKQSPTSHCSLHVSCWLRSRLEGSLQAEKLAYFNGWRPTEAHTRNQKKRRYPGDEREISHKATVVGDKLVVNGKVYFHYDVPTKWLPVNSSVNNQVDYGNGRVQPNNKNHCKVKKNTLMLWSSPKNCLIKARRWRFFCKSNTFIKL